MSVKLLSLLEQAVRHLSILHGPTRAVGVKWDPFTYRSTWDPGTMTHRLPVSILLWLRDIVVARQHYFPTDEPQGFCVCFPGSGVYFVDLRPITSLTLAFPSSSRKADRSDRSRWAVWVSQERN